MRPVLPAGWLTLFVTVALTTLAHAQDDPTLPRREQAMREHVMYITVSGRADDDRAGREFGTAVIVSEQYALTAAHLFFDDDGNRYQDIVVEGRFGATGEIPYTLEVLDQYLPTAERLRSDAISDVAVLVLPELSRTVNPASVCLATPARNAMLYAFGFPAGREYRGRSGVFERPSRDGLWDTQIRFEEGFSGGPVTDSSDRVVGLVTRGTRETRMVLPLRAAAVALQTRIGVTLADCGTPAAAPTSPIVNPGATPNFPPAAAAAIADEGDVETRSICAQTVPANTDWLYLINCSSRAGYVSVGLAAYTGGRVIEEGDITHGEHSFLIRVGLRRDRFVLVSVLDRDQDGYADTVARTFGFVQGHDALQRAILANNGADDGCDRYRLTLESSLHELVACPTAVGWRLLAETDGGGSGDLIPVSEQLAFEHNQARLRCPPELLTARRQCALRLGNTN